MHETGAQGWCSGKTQRDWVEREVGGGIYMGNTCISKKAKWLSEEGLQIAVNRREAKGKGKRKDIPI